NGPCTRPRDGEAAASVINAPSSCRGRGTERFFAYGIGGDLIAQRVTGGPFPTLWAPDFGHPGNHITGTGCNIHGRGDPAVVAIKALRGQRLVTHQGING